MRATAVLLILIAAGGCTSTATVTPAAGTTDVPSTGAKDHEKIAREMYADEPDYPSKWPAEFHIRIVEGVTSDIANAIRNLGGPIGPDQFADSVELSMGEPGAESDAGFGITSTPWKDTPAVKTDVAAVHAAWTKWLSAFRFVERVTVKPKSNPKIPRDGEFEITAQIEVAGRDAQGWRRDAGKAEMAFAKTPRGWRVTKFVAHGMTSERRAKKMFEDTTESWIGSLAPAVKERLTGRTESEAIYDALLADAASIPADVAIEPVAMDSHPGIAVVDADADGWDDLYVWDVRGAATLLRNVARPDGTRGFEDATRALGLDAGDVSAAAFADLDGDGITDVVIGRWFAPSEIRRGVKTAGKIRFVPSAVNRAMALPTEVSAIALADVNHDGRLDVLFARASHDFHARMVELGKAPKDADSYVDQIGPGFVLLMNDGGEWHDGTKAAGLALARNTLSPAFADFNGDGWPDLYVGNDFARANLFVNEKGKFRDISRESGASEIIYGMGASWGDVDGDGKLDLYASAMQSSAGARIMSDEGNFRAKFADSDKTARKLAARGNTLLHWDGAKWSDLTSTPEFGAARNGNWAYGGTFVDVDGDGWQDLVSLNGFFTAPGSPPDGILRDL